MKRKDFFNTSALLGAAIFAPSAALAAKDRTSSRVDPGDDEGLWMDIPVFCSHEHWGSLFCIGTFPGGFKADRVPGAVSPRPVGLLDLLLDPYLGGSLVANGFNFFEFPGDAGAGGKINLLEKAHQDPQEVWKLIQKPLDEFRMKGTYQTLRLGIHYACGHDISELDAAGFAELNRKIRQNYSRMFGWYREIMEKASLENLCRPVHPEYYLGDFSTPDAAAEKAFTYTLMRIDPLLEYWKPEHPARDLLVEGTGIDPVDARSWQDFLERMLDLAESRGCIGIKQLQAYSRDLDFQDHETGRMKFRGDLDKKEVRMFQDWLIHTFCKLAHEKSWPHQVHVGTHNHPHSNPLPLERIARSYPKQKMVMLHCWPYVEEAGFLAQSFPNVYIDTCWQAMLNPGFLKDSLRKWLGYIPTNKITMSNDATSVEMAVGASLLSRKTLRLLLPALETLLGIRKTDYREIARKLLRDNATHIYKV